MAMITMTWDLPPDEKYGAYVDDVYFTNEERTAWIPRMLKQPGCEELRAYRNTFCTTPQILVLYEMDSITSCIRFIESADYVLFMDELRSDGCTNISIHLWGSSPLVPEPMKP